MLARCRITYSCFFLHLLFVPLLGGCRSTGKDLLEAELRTKEGHLRDMHDELERAEYQNEALMRELKTIRQSPNSKITPEQASQTFTLKQITLGRGTGGLDEDNRPGDEAVQVILEPRDGDGHTIKAPGNLHVEALEISTEGLKVPVSTWDISSDQLRRSWKSGFFSTGYILVLPWRECWPASEKVRLTARFTLTDGRVFEADKDIHIRLGPAGLRRGSSAQPVNNRNDGALPDGELPLHMPKEAGKGAIETSSYKWWQVPPATGKPAPAAPVRPADNWRAVAPPSVIDFIQIQRPQPLEYGPGEDPN